MLANTLPCSTHVTFRLAPSHCPPCLLSLVQDESSPSLQPVQR